MIIPLTELAPETLRSIAEAFVLREGTDYGEVEASFDEKVGEVLDGLRRGETVLVYSELHESVDIRSRDAVGQNGDEE